MVKRKSIETLLILYFSFCIFISYASYFYTLSPLIYLPIGVAALVVLHLFNEVNLFRNATNITGITLLFFVLIYGLLYTKAPNYGSSKITILGAWVVFFISFSGIVAGAFRKFLITSIFWGIVFLCLLLVNFGDPYSYLKYAMAHADRLGESEGNASFNPIWAARFLGFLFIFSFYFLWFERKYIILNIGLLIVIFLYLIATGSKGPTIALILSLGVFLSKKQLLANFKFIFPFLIGIVFFGILLAQIDFFDSKFFSQRFNTQSSSVSSRENYIGKAFEISDYKSTIFGTGTGNFGYLINGKDFIYYPHNIFAELFSENGLIGIIVFCIILVQIFNKRAMIYENIQLKFYFTLFVFFFLNAQFSGNLAGNQYLFFSFFTFFSVLKLNQVKRSSPLQPEEIYSLDSSPSIST